MGIYKTYKSGIGRELSSQSDLYSIASRGAKLVFSILLAVSLLAASPGHAQLPYSEDFTTTTYKDADPTQTTADWSATGQVLLPVSPSLTGVTFDPTTVVEVLPGNFRTRDVELADMDGDGDLDIVEGTSSSNGVYLNDGSGNFGVGRAYSGSDSANTRSIAVGDVDRDGDLDFVAGNFSSRIRLYVNDGSGTSFSMQDVAEAPRQTQHLELVDLDGDGFLDVVAANIGFQNNYVYWNTGDPLTPFGPEGSSGDVLDASIKEETRRVAAGDIDNDGDIDLVFFNESEANPNDNNREQRNRVYMNQGGRTFTHAEIEVPASDDSRNSHGGALGDLNGDGFLDLVVVNFLPGEESQIYFNDATGPGDNPFTTPGVFFTTAGDPDFAQTAQIADADHDGDLDIYLVIAGHDFRNRVYFNDGSGTITGFSDVGPVGQAPLVLGDPTDVGPVSNEGALGDVDGDGDLDWVLGNQETQPSNGPLANMLLRNTGIASGTAQLQMHAKATSVVVDTSGVNSVKLSPSPVTVAEGPAFHTSIDYWVTGDGGSSWSPIFADGRPVLVTAGSDLRWRAEMRASSPSFAGGLAINNLDIAANSTGPTLTTPLPNPTTVTEGVSIFSANIFADFDDADGDPLYYSISGLPINTGMLINSRTGQLLGRPTNEDTVASPISVTVTATDGAFSATDSFNIEVTNSNDPPDFTSVPPDLNTGPPATSGATQDVLYTYSISATDPDPGDNAGLVITATHPAWLTLVDNGGGSATLSGTPSAADVFDPNQAVSITVTDTSSATDSQNFSMAIANVNDAPTITSAAVTAATQDAGYTYDITTSDPDDTDTLAITAPTLPAWMTLTDNGDGTASLTGTPSNDDVGDHLVSIAVDDGTAPLVTQDFTVTVADVNDAPTFTSTPVTTGTQDVLYSVAVTTEDIDGDTVTITAPTLPVWLTLTDNGDGTATLTGTPGNANVGNNDVQLSVTDGSLATTQDFTIDVANVNDAPSFTSTPITSASQDVLYTYNITTSDPDVDVLTITAPTLPAWLTLVDNGDGTATLSGTPTNADVGSHNVVLAVSDGTGTINQAFAISVSNVDDAPTFTSGPVTSATQGVLYTYLAMASDPDADPLTFDFNVLPSWLTLIDNGNGTATLSGTPGQGDVGNNPVELTVTDGTTTVTQGFAIDVANVNDAPEFTSTPLTAATEGAAYSYTAVVTDADGDSITITAPMLPAWLTFTDNADGTATLAGTPGGADIGNHSVQLVAIEVGSGGLGDNQDFMITVTAAADGPTITITGSTSVTVTQGSTYTDEGATASDPQDGDLTSQIVVDNPVDTATVGTYMVTYSVQDSAGNTAQAQRTVIVQAPAPTPPPRSSGGGGGSLGLGEMVFFALFALAAGIRRRKWSV